MSDEKYSTPVPVLVERIGNAQKSLDELWDQFREHQTECRESRNSLDRSRRHGDNDLRQDITDVRIKIAAWGALGGGGASAIVYGLITLVKYLKGVV